NGQWVGFHKTPPLASMSQTLEQRLRFGDLKHFRGRRKAFERWRKHIVRLNRTAGRLVEPRERKRGAQLETAGALPPRDGDGGLERFPTRRSVRGIALEQHFAADAMQFRFEG